MYEPAELPAVSPELVAMRLLAEAHWRSLKPKQRLAFQKSLSDLLAEMDEAPIFIRPVAEHATVKRCRAGAQAWLRRVMSDMVRRG